MTQDEILTLKEFMQSQNASLGALFSARIEAVDRTSNAKMDAIEKSISSRIDSTERTFCFARDEQEKRLIEAREGISKRLDSMNEFRSSLKDQNNTFVTRMESSLIHDKLSEELKELRTFKDEMTGKASQSSVNLAMFLGVGGLVLALAGIVIAIVFKG